MPAILACWVSANADPYTGYNVFVHGRQEVIGGTSAVAPLYAGLFVAFGRKLGLVMPQLWLNHTCFNDITKGDNGFFRARVGPDPCTGIGTPIADNWARCLRRHARLLPKQRVLAVADGEMQRRQRESSGGRI